MAYGEKASSCDPLNTNYLLVDMNDTDIGHKE